MVLIDTSIWISLYRKQQLPIAQKMWSLMGRGEAATCGQVWVEYVGGFRRDKKERQLHQRAFQNLIFLEAGPPTYALAADLLAKHPRLGAGDAIIAATALDHQAPLLTLDKDFQCLKKEGLQLI